jgi:copper transport protein
LALVLGLAVPGSAFGHAGLRSSSPFADAVLEQAPREVVLRFTEALEQPFAQLRVYGEESRRYDRGPPRLRDGTELSVPVAPLPPGTYTVVWHALSRDGHVVDGGYVFHIGGPGGPIASDAEEFLARGVPRTLSGGYSLVRFLNIALVLLVAGGTFAIAFVLHDVRALFRTLALCAFLLAVVAVAGIGLQGAIASRDSVASAFSSMLDTRFGHAWLARSALAVALGALALAAARRRGAAIEAMLAAATLLCLTLPAAGHAGVRGVVAFAADSAHVLAAAAWVGGLAFTAAAVAVAQVDGREAFVRFSPVALAAVALLGASAAVNAYSEVGSLEALWRTHYGRLLLLKTGLLAELLLIAYVNRRAVLGRDGGARFLRLAVVELVLMAAVVGVASWLVDEPPPRTPVVAPS